MAASSVKDAAARLGVSERRVRAMLEDGQLQGQKVGGRWLVDLAGASAAGREKLPIKPLSERSSWLLMACAGPMDRQDGASAGDPKADPMPGGNSYSGPDLQIGDFKVDIKVRMSPIERHRLKDRLERLAKASDPVPLLRSWLPNRAAPCRLHANPADLADLRRDDRIVLSGVSHPASGLLAGNEVEAYIRAEDADEVRDDYLLVEPRPDSPPNVVLHVVDDEQDLIGKSRDLPWLALAADLAERSGARENEAARNLVRRALAHSAS